MNGGPEPLLARLGLEESSYFVAQGYHRPFLDALLQEVPEAELRRLAHLTFALLKPDTVLSARVRPALALLAQAGLEVVDLGVCLSTHPRQFEELYKTNLTVYNQQNMVGAWWLNHQIYELAPVVTLLLALPGEGAGDAQRRLAAVKGPSSPYLCQPDQLRARLEASNRSINLLHTADGPVSSAREYLLFQPLSRLREALARLDGGSGCRPFPASRLEAELATLPGAFVETDFLRVLTTLKARLHKALLEQGALAEEPQASSLREQAAVAAGGEPLLERTRAYRELSHRELASLGQLARTASCPLLEAALSLADFDHLDLAVARSTVAAFRGAGLYLSAWEQLLLETSCYYLDDFLAGEPAGPSPRRSVDRAPGMRR
ncbi:MAG TPA: nucleoside-diphosphate kinase [Thermoanaerobaculia bacterium]|nr:nucleoside-diphosphate kinase [Thermoanaerobaculia bacterium]